MSQQRYQVIERIDAGGMAEVFKASSTSMQGFQKLVAIKRILPSLTQDERFVRMFLDEAKVSLYLNHTNIVQVFDLGIADDTYFIVMEFVAGSNLKRYLEFFRERKKRIPIEQAVFMAIEICKGLTHAHEQYDQQGNHLGIVHRDISPPNVLLSMSGEVKLTDFGLAKAKSQVEVTDPGIVKGKFGYLSPEAALGEEVDARTDLFAVGIILWEMLTGRRLFLGETDHETLQLVQSGPIPPVRQYVPDIPPQLEGIVHKALARDMNQRYQNAAQLGQELAEFLFSYGKVVTNYTIGDLVRKIVAYERRNRTPKNGVVSEAVQREVNRIVSLESLEEIRDLDPYLAEHYHSDAHGNEELSVLVQRTMEDPRHWNDLGFPEESGQDQYPILAPQDDLGNPPNAWREGGLERLLPNGYEQHHQNAQHHHIGNNNTVTHHEPDVIHPGQNLYDQRQRVPSATHQTQMRHNQHPLMDARVIWVGVSAIALLLIVMILFLIF